MKHKAFNLFFWALIMIFLTHASWSQHEKQAKDFGHHKATVTKASTHVGTKKVRYHYVLFGGLGSTSYYGQINTSRIGFQSLNYKFTLGLMYRVTNFANIGASITHFRISGSDAMSGTIQSGRKQRNLSFSTPGLEFGFVSRIDILNYTKSKIVDYPQLKGVFPYLIAGAGFLYFEPTAELDGEYHNLRTRITTMQKEMGNIYGPITFYYTGGGGARVKAHQFFSFGIDVTYTFTLSDNLDDLAYNTNYPTMNQDPSFMNSIDGRLADRGPEVTEVEVKRAAGGDPSNPNVGKRTFSKTRLMDGYFMITLKCEYGFQSFNNFLNKKYRSHFGNTRTKWKK